MLLLHLLEERHCLVDLRACQGRIPLTESEHPPERERQLAMLSLSPISLESAKLSSSKVCACARSPPDTWHNCASLKSESAMIRVSPSSLLIITLSVRRSRPLGYSPCSMAKLPRWYSR